MLRLILLFLMLPLLAKAQLKTSAPSPEVKLKRSFRLPPVMEEVSGLYITPEKKFIWHNDGGGATALYQTNGAGRLEKTTVLEDIENIDWEELTADDRGNIFIGDFGNNLNQRKDLRIYRYQPESNQIGTISFSYPDQEQFPPERAYQNFDMEAFFWYRGQLHLFSKNKANAGNYFSKHYVLGDEPGEQIAELRDSIAFCDRVVTAAAISPDKKTVALLAYDFRFRKPLPYSAASIFLIRNFKGTDFLQGDIYRINIPRLFLATQYESIDFTNSQTVYIASEKTKFLAPKAKRIRLKAKYFNKKRLWSKHDNRRP